MAEIILTQSASQDLIDIETYISEHSPSKAQELVNKLLNRVTLLETFPQIGSQVPEFDNEDLRQLIEGNYRILYRIASAEIVFVLRFIHTKRKLEL